MIAAHSQMEPVPGYIHNPELDPFDNARGQVNCRCVQHIAPNVISVGLC